MKNMKKPRLLIMPASLLFFTRLDLICSTFWPYAQLFKLKMKLFWQKKNIQLTRKRFIIQPKRMIFLYNIKFLKAYDLLLLFLHEKHFFGMRMAHTERFYVHKLRPKIAIFRVLINFFFKSTGL